MTRTTAALALLAAMSLSASIGCRRSESRRIDPVGAIRAGVRHEFKAPSDGLLTDAQIETFLKIRRMAGGGTESDAVRSIGADPVEFAWVRARVREARIAWETDRVAAAAGESFARSLAALREARSSARDGKTAARLDAEIAALERERASLKRSASLPPATLQNAVRLSRRRPEIEAATP